MTFQHINGMAQIKKAKHGVVDMDFVLGVGGYDLDRWFFLKNLLLKLLPFPWPRMVSWVIVSKIQVCLLCRVDSEVQSEGSHCGHKHEDEHGSEQQLTFWNISSFLPVLSNVPTLCAFLFFLFFLKKDFYVHELFDSFLLLLWLFIWSEDKDELP